MKIHVLMILVAVAMPLSWAQSTRRLYIEKISVAPTKENGKHWDTWKGAPDVQIAIETQREGAWQKVFSTRTVKNVYILDDIINTQIDVHSKQQLRISVLDEDLSNHDTIGTYVLDVPELDLLVEEKLEVSFAGVESLVIFYSKYKELKLNFPVEKMNKAEQQLGTDSALDRVYHRIVNSPFAPTLRFPGYIIGIEKTARKKIGMSKVKKFREYIDPAPTGCNDVEKSFIARRIDDHGCQFVSHIVEYDEAEKNALNINKQESQIDKRFFYNIYEQLINGETTADQAFDKGWKAIAALKGRLEEQIRRRGITHIFLYSMGWDTSQEDAIVNFNDLFSHVLAKGEQGEGVFRPLFIGISWHSKWTADSISKHWEFIQNKASYISKANDADEIGLLWINHLLRDVLVPLKHQHNCRFIIVGHSFGTRLLTRGIFSYPLLPGTAAVKKTDVDLFVGLQGAFDVKRFIEGVGREGTPYRNFRGCAGRFMFTWSPHDRATAIAKWADFVGDLRGYQKSQRHDKVIAHTAIDEMGQWQLPQNIEDKILMVDASRAVKGHSDIYNEAVACLVWNALDAFTR